MDESAMAPWQEVGDRVFVRRYRFFDQGIGLILGDGAALVIDTRTTPGHARELRDEIRALTDPAGRCGREHARPLGPLLRQRDLRSRAHLGPAGRRPLAGGHRRATASGPSRRPSRTWRRTSRRSCCGRPNVLVDEHATLVVGGRRLELAFHGRAHTDHDLVVAVPDAGVVFAGDIIEEGNAPYFGDGFPIAWPADARGVPGRASGAGRGAGPRRGRRSRVRGATTCGDRGARAPPAVGVGGRVDHGRRAGCVRAVPRADGARGPRPRPAGAGGQVRPLRRPVSPRAPAARAGARGPRCRRSRWRRRSRRPGAGSGPR